MFEEEDPQASAEQQKQEPPEGTTPPAGDDGGQQDDGEEYQGTYETLEDGHLKWDDGVVTDAEGNIVEETPAAPVVPEPAPTPTPTPAPVAQPATSVAQPQRQIYTRDALRQHIFSDKVLEEIADMRLTDAVGAERRMVDLQMQFNDQMDNIRRYAGNIFDQEVEAMRTEAPETLSLVGEQVQRAKQQLSPEQMQQPGIGRQVVAMVAAQMFTQQTSRMEDMARSFRNPPATPPATPGRTPAVSPAAAGTSPAPQPPARRVIPRTERLAGPGSGAPPRPQKRRPGGAGSADSRIRFLMNLHGIGEEEARDMAESLAGVQKELQRSHLGGR